MRQRLFEELRSWCNAAVCWTFRSVRSLASPILQKRCPSGCLLLPLRTKRYAPLACPVKLHNPVFEELPTGWLEAMSQVRRMLVGLRNAVPERFKSQKSASAHPLRCCCPGMSQPSSPNLCEAGDTMTSASQTSGWGCAVTCNCRRVSLVIAKGNASTTQAQRATPASVAVGKVVRRRKLEQGKHKKKHELHGKKQRVYGKKG